MLNRKLVLTAAALAGQVCFASSQAEVAWQTPLDYRAESPTSACYPAAMHVLPNGSLTTVIQRELGPVGLFVLSIGSTGSLVRETSLWTPEPPKSPEAKLEGSGIDQFGRLYISSRVNFTPTFFRFGPDATVQTSVEFQDGRALTHVDPSGYSYWLMRNFVIEKRSPGGGLVYRRSTTSPTSQTFSARFRPTPDGGIAAIATNFWPNSNFTSTIVKLDAAGQIVFERVVLPGPSEQSAGLEVDAQGNLIVVTQGNSLNGRITKFRGTDGAQLWQRTLSSRAGSMVLSSDGYAHVALWTTNGLPTMQRVSPNGGVYAPVAIPGTVVDGRIMLAIDAFNEVYVSGDAGNGALFVSRHSPTGAPRYTQIVSNAVGKLDRLQCAVDSNSGLIVLGTKLTPVGEPAYANLVGINQVPIARPDSFTVPANQQSSPGSFMANDQYARGAGIVMVRLPAHGTLTWGPSGVFKYTPTAGYTGPDSFSYRLTRGSLSSYSAAVTLSVQ